MDGWVDEWVDGWRDGKPKSSNRFTIYAPSSGRDPDRSLLTALAVSITVVASLLRPVLLFLLENRPADVYKYESHICSGRVSRQQVPPKKNATGAAVAFFAAIW